MLNVLYCVFKLPSLLSKNSAMKIPNVIHATLRTIVVKIKIIHSFLTFLLMIDPLHMMVYFNNCNIGEIKTTQQDNQESFEIQTYLAMPTLCYYLLSQFMRLQIPKKFTVNNLTLSVHQS